MFRKTDENRGIRRVCAKADREILAGVEPAQGAIRFQKRIAMAGIDVEQCAAGRIKHANPQGKESITRLAWREKRAKSGDGLFELGALHRSVEKSLRGGHQNCRGGAFSRDVAERNHEASIR